MSGSRLARVAVAVGLVAGAVVVAQTAEPDDVEAAPSIDPIVNPPVADSCGVNVTLVLDASGSIQSSNAVDDVRDAASSFLDSLKNTDSTARVTQFASYAEELAPRTLVNDAELDPNTGDLGRALRGYYNPKPPRPGSATIYRYDGSGSTGSNGNWQTRNGDNQYTNWDQGLDNAGETPSELVVYITDGEPTAYDLNGDTADPDPPKADAGPPPDVGMNTNRGDADDVMLDRAIQEANQIKAAGTRVLAVGVGQATGSSALRQRLTQISGPTIVRDDDLANIDSLNDVDVAVVSDFDDLAQFLRSVVLELCSPSLTITKQAQTPDDASYQPAPGWTIEVEPTVPPSGDSYEWILPDTTPATSKTVVTNANGSAQFQWEPDATVDSTALVTETIQPGYTQGRPGSGNDYRCEARDEFGNVREVTGELTNGEFVIDPIGQEVVTCTLFNSFDYQPAIALDKVDDPLVVRGDVPDEVESTFTVTNPGNAALRVTLTDDRCAPMFVGGDTNGNGLLDPADPFAAAEVWTYTCSRSGPWAGSSVTNTADVVGVDPRGEIVTATDQETVDIFVPDVAIDKTVAPTEVPQDTDTPVTYTYSVTNPGGVPLDDIAVTDAEPGQGTCAPLTFVGGDADNDNLLDLTETWTYTCATTVNIPASDPSLVNTATVEGLPVIAGRPAGLPNPVVTDQDTAVVTAFDADLVLTKSASDALVFPGTPVTYTYTVFNDGTVDLVRSPDIPPSGTGEPRDDWVIDQIGPSGTCAPVGYVSGDTDTDEVLDIGETWNYECTTPITDTAVNVAFVAAVTDNTAAETLIRVAAAEVDVVAPAIDLEKTSVRPTVLDPAALQADGGTAIAGPDVPLPFPAVYRYRAINPGDLPLQNVSITDSYGGTDAACPVESVPPAGTNVGDTNSDGLLDPGEAWEFQCVLNGGDRLTKADSDDGGAQDPQLPAPVTNRATATGEPVAPGVPGVPATVTSPQRTQTVEVIEPAVAITKSVDQPIVLPGTDVTYTFEVTNPGDSPLSNLIVVDDMCAVTPTGDPINAGDTDGDGVLDLDETWLFSCVSEISLPTGGDVDVTNTASALARGPLGNVYFDQDTAVVRVFDPAIDLVKTVDETLVPAGTTVNYSFVVTNSGDSPIPADDVLADVTLVDVSEPAVPSCDDPTFLGGDDNSDDLLDRDPAEVWRYGCSAALDASTVNVAGVGAFGGTRFQPPLPVLVADFDAAFVQVFDPGIDVVKTADPVLLLGGGEVTYTYEVTNTGDVPLADVASRIGDDTCGPVTYVSGDSDGDDLLDTPDSIFEDSLDEVWIFSCTVDVAVTTLNVVTVTGTPTDPGGSQLCSVDEPCDVTDDDTVVVTVADPGSITVIKRTDPATAELFPFEFGTTAFSLGDGQAQTFDGLAPGTYSVTESVPVGWELTSAVCDDGSPVGAIVVDAGEAVTCTFTNSAATTPPLPPVPTDPPGTLPATGADATGTMLQLSGLVLLVGAVVAFASRRRPAAPARR